MVFQAHFIQLLIIVCSPVAHGIYLEGKVPEESGYIEVRNGCFMFYWFFESTNKLTSKEPQPFIIWLQGGPGSSGVGFGNFAEVGPWFTNGTKRPTAWNNVAHLLFIDQPVGTGYSYVENSKDLTRNLEEITQDLLTFLYEFYHGFPHLRASPLYFFCESYGGKVAVHLARELVSRKHEPLNINLKALVLGDAWLSPAHYVIAWPDFLYNLGYVDENGRYLLTLSAQRVLYLLAQGRTEEANFATGDMQNMMKQLTSGVNIYAIQKKFKQDVRRHRLRHAFLPTLRSRNDIVNTELDAIMNGAIKEKLKIPANVHWVFGNKKVFAKHHEDFMKPVTNIVEELLDNTNLDLVIMNGDQDLLIPTVAVSQWINSLHWSGSSTWPTVPRFPIVHNGQVEGYNKTLRNLHFHTLHFAGHMLHEDNPNAGYMIMKQILGVED